MHLTSWLSPSPLGPGIAPWGGLADGAHATLSGQEVAQKPSPAALWQGGGLEGVMLATAGPNGSICSGHTGGLWRGFLCPRLHPGRERGGPDGTATPATSPAWGPRVAGLGLLLGAADDGEDEQEDVDDVCVQVKRREHVLLRAQRQLLVPQQQLGVHGQEAGEEQRAQ